MSELTREQKRIRIAEACGWTGPFGLFGPSGKCAIISLGECLHGTPPDDNGKPEDECRYRPVPDYFGSLDAMAEAEKTLTTDQAHEYYRVLELELGWEYASAKANERSEAFGKTLNLW